MNGKRAKMLRFLAEYDIKEERETLRRYNMEIHPSNHKNNNPTWFVRGKRALYKQLKKRYYDRRAASRL
jgi:hypothetical protein